MPKQIVTAVGSKRRASLGIFERKPQEVSPFQPSCMMRRSGCGRHISRYSSMKRQYSFCSVIESPQTARKSPFSRRVWGWGGAPAAKAFAVAMASKAQNTLRRFIEETLGFLNKSTDIASGK